MWFASTKRRSLTLTSAAGMPGWRAGVLGALLADALGVPHEFKPGADIPPPSAICLQMPSSYRKTYAGVPYGTWSDDGSQLLCLLASLAHGRGQLDPCDFGQRLLSWRHAAYMQAGGEVFDCGVQTGTALTRLQAQPARPLEAGGREERSNGNGSLMRTIPAVASVLEWGLSDRAALQVAMAQSSLTHGHDLSRITCAVYVQLALMVSRLGAPASWRQAALDIFDLVPEVLPLTDAEQAALVRLRLHGETELPTGSGFVLDAFWSAIWALDLGRGYLASVRQAISLGNDTDTTACITGGLAGMAYGLSDVPSDWWPVLQVPAEAKDLFKALQLTA